MNTIKTCHFSSHLRAIKFQNPVSYSDSLIFKTKQIMLQSSENVSFSNANFLKESENFQKRNMGRKEWFVNHFCVKSYQKGINLRKIMISLASPQQISQWAERILPNGKIIGKVTNANTLHFQTFKPQKGGLFCERIFGPLRDFECACGHIIMKSPASKKKNQKRISRLRKIYPVRLRKKIEKYAKIRRYQYKYNLIRKSNKLRNFFQLGVLRPRFLKRKKYCPICDVEYTLSIFRRYQLGYIQFSLPVTHVWFLKGTTSLLGLFLGLEKNTILSLIYNNGISILEISQKSFQKHSEKFTILEPLNIFQSWEKFYSPQTLKKENLTNLFQKLPIESIADPIIRKVPLISKSVVKTRSWLYSYLNTKKKQESFFENSSTEKKTLKIDLFISFLQNPIFQIKNKKNLARENTFYWKEKNYRLKKRTKNPFLYFFSSSFVKKFKKINLIASKKLFAVQKNENGVSLDQSLLQTNLRLGQDLKPKTATYESLESKANYYFLNRYRFLKYNNTYRKIQFGQKKGLHSSDISQIENPFFQKFVHKKLKVSRKTFLQKCLTIIMFNHFKIPRFEKVNFLFSQKEVNLNGSHIKSLVRGQKIGVDSKLFHTSKDYTNNVKKNENKTLSKQHTFSSNLLMSTNQRNLKILSLIWKILYKTAFEKAFSQFKSQYHTLQILYDSENSSYKYNLNEQKSSFWSPVKNLRFLTKRSFFRSIIEKNRFITNQPFCQIVSLFLKNKKKKKANQLFVKNHSISSVFNKVRKRKISNKQVLSYEKLLKKITFLKKSVFSLKQETIQLFLQNGNDFINILFTNLVKILTVLLILFISTYQGRLGPGIRNKKQAVSCLSNSLISFNSNHISLSQDPSFKDPIQIINEKKKLRENDLFIQKKFNSKYKKPKHWHGNAKYPKGSGMNLQTKICVRSNSEFKQYLSNLNKGRKSKIENLNLLASEDREQKFNNVRFHQNLSDPNYSNTQFTQKPFQTTEAPLSLNFFYQFSFRERWIDSVSIEALIDFISSPPFLEDKILLNKIFSKTRMQLKNNIHTSKKFRLESFKPTIEIGGEFRDIQFQKKFLNQSVDYESINSEQKTSNPTSTYKQEIVEQSLATQSLQVGLVKEKVDHYNTKYIVGNDASFSGAGLVQKILKTMSLKACYIQTIIDLKAIYFQKRRLQKKIKLYKIFLIPSYVIRICCHYILYVFTGSRTSSRSYDPVYELVGLIKHEESNEMKKSNKSQKSSLFEEFQGFSEEHNAKMILKVILKKFEKFPELTKLLKEFRNSGNLFHFYQLRFFLQPGFPFDCSRPLYFPSPDELVSQAYTSFQIIEERKRRLKMTNYLTSLGIQEIRFQKKILPFLAITENLDEKKKNDFLRLKEEIEIKEYQKKLRVAIKNIKQPIRKMTQNLSYLKQIKPKLIKRIKLLQFFLIGKSDPESMLLKVLPVLPADLRPIMKLGDEIAVSDLNRLYQKIIYRNDRLKTIIKQPKTEYSNEIRFAHRLLQEAVDNLIDNGKSGTKAETDSRGRALKSFTEILKGKSGRFRQNLLGKRVDYSGRSVIVVGPKLKLHECGIPYEMASELFLPFLLKRIFNSKIAKTLKGAKTLIRTNIPFTKELLREIMQVTPVLLNRAPTLHRLGIQAFQPKLVEGKAILLHPLVCPAFNADFDGDQMGVHVPITVEARAEALKLMFSRNNLLSAATGDPLVLPSQDMVLGSYYLTTEKKQNRQIMTPGFLGFNDQIKETAVLQEKISSLSFNDSIEMNSMKSFTSISEKKVSTIFKISDVYTTFTPLNSCFNELELKDSKFLPFLKKTAEKTIQKLSTCFFHSIESALMKYNYDKIVTSHGIGDNLQEKIHSSIWVKWEKKVEIGIHSEQPLEIRLNSYGYRYEIYTKLLCQYDPLNKKINQYIQTTPGKILFNLLIQQCSPNL